MQRRIRVKLESYDQGLLDISVKRMLSVMDNLDVVVSGPVFLPTKKERFTVLKSPHVYKKSREQFQICTHVRLLDVYANSQKAVMGLSKVEIPNGVRISVS